MGNAIALSGILLNMSRLIGPAVAGLLIARSGEAACFELNAVSYVAVVASLLMLRPRPVEARVGSAGEFARIREGLRYCFEDPERRSILLLLAAVSVAGMPAMMLLPVYSEGILHAGPQGFGYLTTAFAVGALLASASLARRVKSAGLRIWFASGLGVVRVRMYRSFSAMWEGWKKNLFQLMGGTTGSFFAEFEYAFPWMILVILIIGIKLPVAVFAGVILLLLRQVSYGMALSRNHFPFKYIIYYLPAIFLYAGVLWASHESYAKGKVTWKGREYSVGVGASNK